MSQESSKPFEELDKISDDEKGFLMAVERGDTATVKRLVGLRRK